MSAPHDAEPHDRVLGEEPAGRLGVRSARCGRQEFERSPQYRPGPLRRRPRAAYLEHQRPFRPLKQLAQLPGVPVEPGVQLPPDPDELIGTRARLHRPHVPPGEPGQQLNVAVPEYPPWPDPLVSRQQLKTSVIDNEARHHTPPPKATAPLHGRRPRSAHNRHTK